MTHYHILTGPRGAVPVSDVIYDNYEEGIVVFVDLANTMYKKLRGSEYDLSLEQALEATKHGEARGAYVGPPALTLFWLRCEDEVHYVPAWN